MTHTHSTLLAAATALALALGSAHAAAQDAAGTAGQSEAARITIKQKSPYINSGTQREVGGCTPPYVWSTLQQKCVLPIRYQNSMIGAANSNARPVPPQPPGSGDEPLPPHEGPIGIPSDGPMPHPKDPLPPHPRPTPIPADLPTHHMPRDPGMGNGESPQNPGGNPVEPALPCPPGFTLTTLKGGKQTCTRPAPVNPAPAPTDRQAAPAQDHVQICPPYCGNNTQQTARPPAAPRPPVLINRPQPPKPIEERLGSPNAPGTEPGGIMGPAGSPVPAEMKCPPGTKAVPVNPPHPFPKHCVVPTD
jgi:hypothetical protein